LSSGLGNGGKGQVIASSLGSRGLVGNADCMVGIH